jgi:hypothetical protein
MDTQLNALPTLPVLARGVLSVGIPRFLNKSQHFTVYLFRPWRPGSARGSDGGPRRFTEVVPTPHAYNGQWPVKTKRARARSCASAVTRKRPSLNRADGPARTNPNFDHPSGGRLCPVPIAKAGREGCRPLGKNEATFHCCVLC